MLFRSREIDFSSLNALNPGQVKVTLDDDQSVTVLPKAPTTEQVAYDVSATDQFGNLTQAPVSLKDDSAAADISDTSVTTGFTDNPTVVYASANAATNQTVTGTWVADTLTWTDADTTTAGFQEESAGVDGTKGGTTTVTGSSDAVNWYVVDFANSTYTLDHSGADTQPVGSVVTETYKAVDQNGEPIEDLFVQFFRAGPDDLQDGSGNSGDYTDQDGVASYIFQGAKAGTATITAVVRDGNGQVIPQAGLTDSVDFGAVTTKSYINMRLSGSSRYGKDRIAIGADAIAAGSAATIYRNGTKVGTVLLNSAGDAVFKIKDKNGNAKTKYTVKVDATSTTYAASKSIRIR